jgi:hypothetical protein
MVPNLAGIWNAARPEEEDQRVRGGYVLGFLICNWRRREGTEKGKRRQN